MDRDPNMLVGGEHQEYLGWCKEVIHSAPMQRILGAFESHDERFLTEAKNEHSTITSYVGSIETEYSPETIIYLYRDARTPTVKHLFLGFGFENVTISINGPDTFNHPIKHRKTDNGHSKSKIRPEEFHDIENKQKLELALSQIAEAIEA